MSTTATGPCCPSLLFQTWPGPSCLAPSKHCTANSVRKSFPQPDWSLLTVLGHHWPGSITWDSPIGWRSPFWKVVFCTDDCAGVDTGSYFAVFGIRKFHDRIRDFVLCTIPINIWFSQRKLKLATTFFKHMKTFLDYLHKNEKFQSANIRTLDYVSICRIIIIYMCCYCHCLVLF